MANAQDAKNKGKIEKSIDDLTSQSQDKLKDELEQGAAVLLQRQMNNAKRKVDNDIENDIATPLTLDDQKKKNIKDRSIGQTFPENLAETQSAPDKIYRPKEEQKQPEPKDMFVDQKNEKDEPEEQKKIAPEKGEAAKATAGNKTDEEIVAPDKTPEWLKEEPKTAIGGIARADTGDISPKKSRKRKNKPPDKNNKNKKKNKEKNYINKNGWNNKRKQKKKRKKKPKKKEREQKEK